MCSVLYLEDNLDLAEIVQALLGEGVDITHVSTFKGLQKALASGESFSLVISDVHVPGLNGQRASYQGDFIFHETRRYLGQDIPLVFLTAEPSTVRHLLANPNVVVYDKMNIDAWKGALQEMVNACD